MKQIITFKGRNYRLSETYYKGRISSRYYRRYNWGKGGPSSLHRAVWEDHYGPIPEGFEIHHRDGDGTNNELSNLEMLDGREHQRQHTLERIRNGKLKPPSKLALKRAAEWHRSKEGQRWHKKHGPQTWKNRVWHLCTCQECGREFRSPYPTRVKFCHLNCKMTALRKRRGLVVGTRPNRRKIAKLSNKQAP